jgi:hypothetical protein
MWLCFRPNHCRINQSINQSSPDLLCLNFIFFFVINFQKKIRKQSSSYPSRSLSVFPRHNKGFKSTWSTHVTQSFDSRGKFMTSDRHPLLPYCVKYGIRYFIPGSGLENHRLYFLILFFDFDANHYFEATN